MGLIQIFFPELFLYPWRSVKSVVKIDRLGLRNLGSDVLSGNSHFDRMFQAVVAERNRVTGNFASIDQQRRRRN